MFRLRHLFLIVTGVCLAAQVSSSAQSRADSLRKAYMFAEAVEESTRALATADSASMAALEEDLTLSQNGLSMTEFCYFPQVVARQTFAADDFFLYYPLKDKAWRAAPNQLDTLGGVGLARATYMPDDVDELYYSAMDGEVHDIMHTRLRDTSWTWPERVGGELMASSDDIFPIVSEDRRHLYFASKGLYGMGGYDLYAAEWDDEAGTWGTPVNMGFPYSSPYDDFLYIDTEDGRYSIFASNRGCAADSVNIYVLEYDDMPVRRKVDGADNLRDLATLEPSRVSYGGETAIQPQEEDAGVSRYMEKMGVVRSLRDSISQHNKALSQLRDLLTSDETADHSAVREDILQREKAIPAMQQRLEQALRELQQVEMDFLVQGIVIDPDKLMADADREMEPAQSGYVFSKRDMGPALHMKMEPPPAVPVPELPAVEIPDIELSEIVAD